MPKFEVTIDGVFCKGCELCRVNCPKDIIVMNKVINDKGYYIAQIDEIEKCTGCKCCAIMCPEGAISIYKEGA